MIQKAMDFWQAAEKAGPPGKDNRWCCKLLKLHPLKLYLADIGPCVTVQGNRWYESWNRAGLDETSQNPANPLQLNISPIRNWRALEVFLYLWWQGLPINPLYDRGLERIGCLPLPGDARERVRGTQNDPAGICRTVDGVPRIVGSKERVPGCVLVMGALAVAGPPAQDAGALPAERDRLQR